MLQRIVKTFLFQDDYIIQWKCWKEVLGKINGELFAWVFLPNHSHIILKQGVRSFSDTMSSFKRRVTWMMKQPGGIWQNRFWEHLLRNDNDLERHTDYIHVNPVNHGLTKRAQDYPYSSFKMFVEKEAYPEDWGSVVEIEVTGEPID
jgi:putative transposase